MRKATRIIAASFGVFAGIGGLEHGYFEILQGNVPPESLMIASMGPPCVPEEVWHACEPAMTILPSFLTTGILALLFGMITIAWSAFFVQRRWGGIILILLSIALLLFGGGIFPPVIGVIGGVVGTRINTPMKRQPTRVWRMFATIWPWALIIFFIFLFSQFVLGYFFNDFIIANAAVAFPLLILILMVVSILSAFGHDVSEVNRSEIL
jgi:hypothetical protein